MDNNTNAKLDRIIGLLEVIIERQQDQEEQIAELQESIANLSLPGSGYSIFTPEED